VTAYTLAVRAEMVYRDLPLLEWVRRIHDQGFAVPSGISPPFS